MWRGSREMSITSGATIHAEGQLILNDPSDGFGVADGLGLPAIELLERVKCLPAAGLIHSRRVGQKQDRITRRTALDTLMNRRQEPAPPDAFARVRSLAAATQDDKSRQVLILRTQTIRRPRTHRRTAELG